MKVLQPSGKILFRETQQFRQVWLWALILASTVPALVITSITLWHDEKTTLATKFMILGMVVLITGINILMLVIVKLDTVVSDAGVYYRWRPFRTKYIVLNWRDVATVTAKKYPYLSYGFHRRPGFGKVNNVNGNKGILFELKDGKRVYLGTQKLKPLQYSLEQVRTVEVDPKLKDKI